MDHRSCFFHYGQHAKSSFGLLDSNHFQTKNSLTNSGTLHNPPNNGNDRTKEQHVAPPHLVKQEEEQCMPTANVIRIMRQVLPPRAKVSDDAMNTIQECVSEFISFITGEANERCKREHRKIVSAEDVLLAMEMMGFDNYVETLTVFLHRYRQNEANHSTYRMLPPPPPPPSASYGSSFPVDPNPYLGMMDPMGMGGLYRNGSGTNGMGSDNAKTNFDLFPYLKHDRL